MQRFGGETSKTDLTVLESTTTHCSSVGKATDLCGKAQADVSHDPQLMARYVLPVHSNQNTDVFDLC